MSMSTHVTGFAPPDATWTKMKAVWDACQAANVPVPQTVDDFFDGEDPDPAGIEIDLPLREWHDAVGTSSGYELDLAAVPPHVKTLRFYNSW